MVLYQLVSYFFLATVGLQVNSFLIAVMFLDLQALVKKPKNLILPYCQNVEDYEGNKNMFNKRVQSVSEEFSSAIKKFDIAKLKKIITRCEYLINDRIFDSPPSTNSELGGLKSSKIFNAVEYLCYYIFFNKIDDQKKRNVLVELISLLVQHGGDLSAQNKYYCDFNNTLIVQSLAAESMNRDWFPERLISLMVKYKKTRALILHDSKDNNDALKFAIKMQCEHKIIKKIVSAMTNKERKYALRSLDKGGNTALHLLCIRNDMQSVDFLMRSGADVTLTNWAGYRPFFYLHLKNNRFFQEDIMVEYLSCEILEDEDFRIVAKHRLCIAQLSFIGNGGHKLYRSMFEKRIGGKKLLNRKPLDIELLQDKQKLFKAHVASIEVAVKFYNKYLTPDQRKKVADMLLECADFNYWHTVVYDSVFTHKFPCDMLISTFDIYYEQFRDHKTPIKDFFAGIDKIRKDLMTAKKMCEDLRTKNIALPLPDEAPEVVVKGEKINIMM